LGADSQSVIRRQKWRQYSDLTKKVLKKPITGLDVPGGWWKIKVVPVAVRFFSGHPLSHLLGVCRRTPFLSG
jgi:hypothetical protein